MWYRSSQNSALPKRKLRDLGAAVVEDLGAPVAVLAGGVLVLVEVRAVEVAEAVEVAREVRGDPVEDHADAVAGAGVDEVPKSSGVP